MSNENLPQTLEVLIIYDNLEAGKQAKALCDRISRSLGPDFTLAPSVWKSSLFRFPEMSRAATRAATQAVAIIFVLAGWKDMLPELQVWVEGLRGNGRPYRDCALVVLLHDIPALSLDSAPAWIALSRSARNAGMEVFAEVIQARQDECDYSIEGIYKRAVSHSAVLDAILQHH